MLVKGLKEPAICASLMEGSVEDFLAAARDVKGADMLEVRADSLENSSPATVKRLLKNLRIQVDLPIILANRWEKEGGVFPGNERERIGILLEAMELADMVDIELRAEKAMRDEVIALAKEKMKPVIVSYHDFSGTPEVEVMRQVLEEEFAIGASVAKLAVTANNKGDVLRLLQVTHDSASLGPLCTISMGDLGRISRIAAPFFGSKIIYASIGKPTASGQLEVGVVRQVMDILRGPW